MGREGCCRKISLACVQSTCSVPATLGLPLLEACLHCSGYRLLYREQALSCVRFQFSGTPQKCRLGWACVLCLPWPSSSGSQELDGPTLPRCSAPYPLRGPSLSFRARAGRVFLVSLLGSWSLAATLPEDINHPVSQEVFG